MNEWREKKPLEWRRFINNHVKVTAHEKQQYEGWVFTVDPVSASIVLVNFEEVGRTSIIVVMGHAVEVVEILKEGGHEMEERLTSLFLPVEHEGLSKEELRRRKDSLRVWLEKNRIPVTEDGESLRVAGVLSVDPPYGPQDCTSSNEIILSRVQSLVQSNPVNMHSVTS